jgi:galactokinase
MPDRRSTRGAPTFRAPGRVNLIGGQVDYHEGLVVTMALDREVRVTASPRHDGRVCARSRELEGDVAVAADGSDDPTAVAPPWGRLVAGVVRTLAEAGREPVGADLEVSSTVPVGAGLSSSAAFEVAIGLALSNVAGLSLSPHALMLAAQRAEHVATGVPCGVQDQMTSVFGRVGHALLIDCRTLNGTPIALPPGAGVLVVHSGVHRVLEHTAYAERRAESLSVARRLGLRVLRDAHLEQVRDEPRGRHAVTEIDRVRRFHASLAAGDLVTAGALMLASHRSSRDDMQVSTPELDVLVDTLVASGAYGARLTGAGFGGCAVALVAAEQTSEISSRATAEYRQRTRREPHAWPVRAAAGAGRLEQADGSEAES